MATFARPLEEPVLRVNRSCIQRTQTQTPKRKQIHSQNANETSARHAGPLPPTHRRQARAPRPPP
eukprot:1527490-Lingulodinium_polyedra.AAC.1